MATDSSPPRIRIILTTAFSSLVILVALNYVFKSYFLMMTEEVEHDHLAKPEELMKLHAGEERNLASAPLPIAQAMQELSRGRNNEALKARADITPQPSNDLAPMVGWIRAPNQAVIDRINQEAANPTPAPVPAAGLDAGSPLVDAGADAGKGPAPKGAPGGAPPTGKPPLAAPHDAGRH